MTFDYTSGIGGDVKSVHEVLEEALPGAETAATGGWVVRTDAGSVAVRIRPEQDWVVFSAPAAPARASSLVLRLEDLLADGHLVKPVLDACNELQIVAETPREGLTPMTAWLLARAVRAAADRYPGARGSASARARVSSRLEEHVVTFASAPPVTPEAIIRWLSDGDEAVTVATRGDGRWVLQTRDPVHDRSLEVEVGEGADLVARSPVTGPIANLSPRCRRAFLIWMGCANAWIRLARLGFNDQRSIEARAECPLASATPSLCAKVVEATSAAAACFQEEAAALRHESVADAYISAHSDLAILKTKKKEV